MKLHGWTVRPVRRYRRERDGGESVFCGASRHVEGRHETVYFGKAEQAASEAELCAELARQLRRKTHPE